MRSLNFGTSGLALVALLALRCASSDPGAEEPVARTQGALKAGEACTSASQCEASAPFCVDGVCCTTSCASPCTACAASLKQSLSGSGTCGPTLAGFDPHDDCAVDPVASCGKTGACNGSGACAIYPQGTSCKTQTGQTNECVFQSSKGTICSGSGTGTCYTETSPSGVPCAPYACKNGACAFPCAADADCQPPNRCEAGVCKPKRANGAPCTTAAECDSGNCTDGVCCDSSCGGQCVACNLAGKVGTCTVVVGAAPVAPRPDCAGTAPCKGTCAGDPNKCSYPNDATKCGSAQCSGDVSTPAPACDGTGNCVPKTTDPCTPFGCDSTTGACKATCAGNADCAQGAVCDTNSSKCAIASATCKDAFTVAMPNGQTQSCVPYKCVGGKCQQQCSTSGDCAPGYGCVGPSCVAETDGGGGTGGTSAGGAAGSGGSGVTGGSGGSAAAATGGTSAAGGSPTGGASSGGGASEDEGGCGCRAPKKSPRHDGALLLALAGALTLRRRGLRARR